MVKVLLAIILFELVIFEKVKSAELVVEISPKLESEPEDFKVKDLVSEEITESELLISEAALILRFPLERILFELVMFEVPETVKSLCEEIEPEFVRNELGVRSEEEKFKVRVASE